jgi:hypothetical protein
VRVWLGGGGLGNKWLRDITLWFAASPTFVATPSTLIAYAGLRKEIEEYV